MSEQNSGWSIDFATEENGGSSVLDENGSPIAWHVSQKHVRLISAAPKLLAALKECLTLIRVEVIDGAHSLEAYSAVRAICEAEGT